MSYKMSLYIYICNFISILPCNHAFETQVILKWFKTENACCQVCRYYLDFSDVLA